MMYRNHLVYTVRTKALNILLKNNITAIEENKSYISLDKIFDKYPSYEMMLFDFRKWAFNQFFPVLKQK
jgi:hypothetical protein